MKLIDYLPRFMQKLREIADIMAAEQPEIDSIWHKIKQMPDEFFLDTMTVYGIERWESILNLAPLETDTLQDRRFAVKIRLFERLPYTFRRMVLQLEALLGQGNFEATVYHDKYLLSLGIAFYTKSLYNRHVDVRAASFTHQALKRKIHQDIKDVWFHPENQKLYNEILKMLRRMIPANMLLELYFIYTRHINIKELGLTHDDLQKLMHIQIKEEAREWRQLPQT